MAALQNLCNKSMVLSQGMISLPLTDTSIAVSHYLEKFSTTVKSSIAGRKDRKGVGEIVMTDFKILNGKGIIPENFISGQKIFFRIDYECKQSVASVNLSAAISITNTEGFLITVLSTEFINYPIKNSDNKGAIICSLDKLPLCQGAYTINLIIRNNGIIQDWIIDADTLYVENGDYFGTGRTVEATHKSLLLEQQWHYEKS
jgi:lipopolysaccharide transport system ATP-binding protein